MEADFCQLHVLLQWPFVKVMLSDRSRKDIIHTFIHNLSIGAAAHLSSPTYVRCTCNRIRSVNTCTVRTEHSTPFTGKGTFRIHILCSLTLYRAEMTHEPRKYRISQLHLLHKRTGARKLLKMLPTKNWLSEIRRRRRRRRRRIYFLHLDKQR